MQLQRTQVVLIKATKFNYDIVVTEDGQHLRVRKENGHVFGSLEEDFFDETFPAGELIVIKPVKAGGGVPAWTRDYSCEKSDID